MHIRSYTCVARYILYEPQHAASRSSGSTSDMKRSKTNAQPQVKVADPSESSQTVEECLVVKDKDLNQFISPYPNRSVSIMGSRDMNNLVAALNRRFYAFIDDK